jgi:glutathione reductase (NADPH)
MTEFDYDLFIIGAGSGGVRAARMSAGYGADVAIAEEYRVGGTCVIRGCIPKKLLVYASRFEEEFADATPYGWSLDTPRFDWKTLIANKDNEIARLEGLYRKNVSAAGATIINDRAVLKDKNTVHLVGAKRDVTAGTILIATGARPWMPQDLPGLEHTITSNEAFDLPQLPKNIVIAGAGYIAIEFACIFNGLGSDVTLVYRGASILRGFDHDIRTHVHREMEKRGIRVVLDEIFTEIKEVGGKKQVTLRSGKTLTTDVVMMAIGRDPNTQGLGLESAGVKLGEDGAVIVDKYGQTSVPNIYAIGDVTDRLNLTPVAIRDGAAFAETVFNHRPTEVDRIDVPSAVFSSPEVGTVGLSEDEARKHSSDIDIYRAIFRPLKATISGRDTQVMMKLVVDAKSDRVLGCHIVGEGAAEMAQCLAIAVKMKAKKSDFDATLALHPSAAEELVLLKSKVVLQIPDVEGKAPPSLTNV